MLDKYDTILSQKIKMYFSKISVIYEMTIPFYVFWIKEKHKYLMFSTNFILSRK